MAPPAPTPADIAATAKRRKAQRDVLEQRHIQRKQQAECLAVGLIQEYLLEEFRLHGTDTFLAPEVQSELCRRWPAARPLISAYFCDTPAQAAAVVGRGPEPAVLTVVTWFRPSRLYAENRVFRFYTEVRNHQTGAVCKGKGTTQEVAEVAALTKAVKSVKLLQPFSVRHGQSQGVAGRACFCQTCRSIPLLVDRQCFVPLKSGRYLDEYLNHVAEVSAQLRVSSLPGVVMVGQQRDPGVAVKGPIGGLLDGVVAQDARKAVGSLNTRFGQQKVDVYTDASCSRSGAVATAAGVSADGNYFAFKVEQPDSGLLTTNYCEAIGVMAAVQTWWGLGRRLIIHTDSQAIVSGVRKYLAGKDLTLHQETQGVVRQIAELTKIYAALGGSIKFKWVPGHAGVHLNEIADRLARAARHTNHPVVGKDAKNTIFANIIADAQSPPPQSKPTVSGQARLMDKISGTAG